MKKYKVNIGFRVNTAISASGIKWQYKGKVSEQNWEEVYGNRRYVRITDIETGEIVYEKISK